MLLFFNTESMKLQPRVSTKETGEQPSPTSDKPNPDIQEILRIAEPQTSDQINHDDIIPQYLDFQKKGNALQ